MSTLQPFDIAARSATASPAPPAQRQAALTKLIDTSACTGCRACEVACAQWNGLGLGADIGVDAPRGLTPDAWTVVRFSEVEPAPGRLEWLMRKDGCLHCADPGCLKACPAPGAIVQYANGIVDFIGEHCIGCGRCVAGCPFDVPRLSSVDGKAGKCSLCSDRVAVGLEPACVKACPTDALQFGGRDDMQARAAERVADLKARGHDKAGVYDPPGVGGTHVVYVLRHADRPQRYGGLPADPRVGALVSLWKGAGKPLALLAVAAAAVGGFFLRRRRAVPGSAADDGAADADAAPALHGDEPRDAATPDGAATAVGPAVPAGGVPDLADPPAAAPDADVLPAVADFRAEPPAVADFRASTPSDDER